MADNMALTRTTCTECCAVAYSALLVAGAVLRTGASPDVRAEGLAMMHDALEQLTAHLVCWEAHDIDG